VVGQHSANGMFTAMESGGPTGNGYIYNSETAEDGTPSWEPAMRKRDQDYGFDYFDTDVLDPLRRGETVTFGDIDIHSTLQLYTYLEDPEYIGEAQAVLGGIFNGYVNHLETLHAEADERLNQTLANIRRSYDYPGSSNDLAEGEAEYTARHGF
jgi:hypothetical protein